MRASRQHGRSTASANRRRRDRTRRVRTAMLLLALTVFAAIWRFLDVLLDDGEFTAMVVGMLVVIVLGAFGDTAGQRAARAPANAERHR